MARGSSVYGKLKVGRSRRLKKARIQLNDGIGVNPPNDAASTRIGVIFD